MDRIKFKNKVRRFNRRVLLTVKNPLTYLYLFIVFLLVIGTVIVVKTEQPNLVEDGEIAQGWKDAIWHTIVAVVAAYYDFYMKSIPGRMASLVLLLVGMAFWNIVTAKITSVIMNAQMKHNKGLKKIRKMKGHFLICGWRPGFEKILETVMQSNFDISSDKIILVNEAPSENIEQLKSNLKFKDVNYVSGDYTDAEVLKKAYVDKAERVLVIADNSKSQSQMEMDSRTVLAVFSIRNANPKVYIAAELLDEKFEEHLKLSNCNEIILTQEYEHSLLATASSGQGYSNVIKALISDDADSGVIVGMIPNAFFGKTYKEYFDYVDTTNDDGQILVGLLISDSKRENVPVLTPDDGFVIPDNSKSILVCSGTED